MIDKKRVLKAIVIGIIVGFTYEYILTPYVEKPIEKEIERYS